MKEEIRTPGAPAAIGPYSQGIAAEGLIFTSGQLGLVPETGDFAPGGIREQTRQSLENVKAVLEAAGSGMDKVVKTTVLLKDIGDFAAMNEVYARYFDGPCPARSAFQAAALPKGGLVEIEAVALR